MHRFLAAAALFSLAPTVSLASSATVPFDANVSSNCLISVLSAGFLRQGTDQAKLSSSAEDGGVSGMVQVRTTGSSYSLSTEAPPAWSLQPGGAEDTTFSSSYRVSGDTTTGTTPGTVATLLNMGMADVSIDLEAVKSSGVFPHGAYKAEVTVRCE